MSGTESKPVEIELREFTKLPKPKILTVEASPEPMAGAGAGTGAGSGTSSSKAPPALPYAVTFFMTLVQQSPAVRGENQKTPQVRVIEKKDPSLNKKSYSWEALNIKKPSSQLFKK